MPSRRSSRSARGRGVRRRTGIRSLTIDDDTLRRTEVLSAVASAISSAEYLATPADRAPGGWNHWPTQRRRVVRREGTPATVVLDAVGRERVEKGIHLLRIGCVLALVVPGAPAPLRAAANLSLAGTGMLLAPKHYYGSEGADHVTIMTHALCGTARALPRHRGAALDALALQGAASYAMSGLGKLAGDEWRRGSALGSLTRTRSYGRAEVAERLRTHPRAARAMTWGVVAAEIAAPAALVAPPPAARALVWSMRGFHVANAAMIGLNRFVWAFAALHPAMVRMSERIHAR